MMMAMAVAAAVGVQPDAAITWHTSRDRTLEIKSRAPHWVCAMA